MAAKDYKIFDGTNWVSPCDQEIRMLMPDGVTWQLLDPNNEDVNYFDGTTWKPMICVDPVPPSPPIRCTQGSLSGSGGSGIYYIPMLLEANVCDVTITLSVVSVPDSLAILSADKSTVLIQTGFFGSGVNPTPGPYSFGLFKQRKIYTYNPATASNFSLDPLAPNETLTVLPNQFPITDTNPLNVPNSKDPANPTQTVRTITWTKGITPTDVNVLIRVVGHPDSGTAWSISAIACANCPPPPPTCTPSCGAWVYTYTSWSDWSTCVSSSQTRTRTANGTRTCILADCSTTVETSSNIETEIQSCTLPPPIPPCPNCVAHDVPLIGTQVWTGCNATVSTYRDNTLIPYVDDATQWSNLTTGAWCYYDNDPTNEPIYGKLYNWYAIAGVHDTASLTNPALRKEFAPVGYHVPTKDEFTTLTNFIGGLSVTGTKLKEIGDCHWLGGSGATDDYGFTALPAGWRLSYGPFNLITTHCNWWSSTEFNGTFTWGINLNNNGTYGSIAYMPRKSGLSVRFVKDSTPPPVPCPNCVAHNVPIGTQVWTGCNTDIAVYRDNTLIPYVDDNTQWNSLTTGAWRYYNNDPANGPIYGKLYNWYAIAGIYNAASFADPSLRKQFAPTGYHVPSKTEFETLISFLGGGAVAGGKLKEQGFCHWDSPNTNATNTSSFAAFGGGNCGPDGISNALKLYGVWWSSTPYDSDIANVLVLYYTYADAWVNLSDTKAGQSVRFIQD